MSEKTGIEWTTHTMNPWIGCSKVSPGCKNCYAETLDNRYYGGTHWGKGAPRKRTSASTWRNPVKWDSEVSVHPDYRARVFPSLCDWLDDEVPIEWLADFLKLIHDTPNLDWLLLTKRPENFGSLFDTMRRLTFIKERKWIDEWYSGSPPHNVWIGVSVENQAMADLRIPQLLQIPAKVRFLSVEPLLERVNLRFWYDDDNETFLPYSACGNSKEPTNELNWVIIGGESGGDRRDCGVEAICEVARQCVGAGVPCFVKQDSAFKPGQRGRIPDEVWALKQFPK